MMKISDEEFMLRAEALRAKRGHRSIAGMLEQRFIGKIAACMILDILFVIIVTVIYNFMFVHPIDEKTFGQVMKWILDFMICAEIVFLCHQLWTGRMRLNRIHKNYKSFL